jgi:hypothetical protein
MAGQTTNYLFDYPTSTDYVKDGATAIQTLATDVDTTLFTALGGAYPGLRLIKKQSVGSLVSSVNVNGAFSGTYDNYKIIYTGGVMSIQNNILMYLGASTSDYSNALIYCPYTGTPTITGLNNNNGPSWNYVGFGNTTSCTLSVDLFQPNISNNTFMSTPHMQQVGLVAGFNAGVINNTTSYTSFVLAPMSGTFSGGTIYVYGYGTS